MERKAKEILENEFELECRIRKRQIAQLESEIKRGELILASLGDAIRDGADIVDYDSDKFVPFLLSGDLNRPKRSRLDDNLELSTSSSIRPDSLRTGIFARRKDGSFVILTCPECHRSDFGSKAGFVNHCRNAHSLSMSGFGEIVDKCGIAVNESDIPPDDPCRWEATVGEFEHLDEIPLPDQTNSIIPSIKVFDNDQQTSTSSDGHENSGDSRLPSLRDQDSPSDDNANDADLSGTQQNDRALNYDMEDNEQEMESSDGDDNEQDSDEAASQVNTAPSGLTPLGLPSIHIQKETQSRFYLKKRIVVGNISKFIVPYRRKNPRNTFKWMIYVKELNPNILEMNSIASYIKCVKFYLHPSYKPRDVIEVTKPPFQLVKSGWGEFPIRVRLIFWDEGINKPIDIIHQLSFDQSFSNVATQGPERIFDIDLDRNTNLRDWKVLENPFHDSDRNYVEGSESEAEVEAEEQLVMRWSKPTRQASRPKNKPKESIVKDDFKIEEKYGSGTYCHFCGSDTTIRRFDYGIETNRVESTPPHDPQKCQFRPTTKKGKVRMTFSSLSSLEDLLRPIEICLDSQSKLLELKPDTQTLLKSDVDISTCKEPIDIMRKWPLKVAAGQYISFRRTLTDLNAAKPALTQRASEATTHMMYLATAAFLKKLLTASSKIYDEELRVEDEDEQIMRQCGDLPSEQPSSDSSATVENPIQKKQPKILTPFHVYRALFNEKMGEYDFLCKSYLEYPKPAKPSPNAISETTPQQSDEE